MEGAVTPKIGFRPRPSRRGVRTGGVIQRGEDHAHEEESVVVVEERAIVEIEKIREARSVREFDLPVLHVTLRVEVQKPRQTSERRSGRIPMMDRGAIVSRQHSVHVRETYRHWAAGASENEEVG